MKEKSLSFYCLINLTNLLFRKKI